MDKKTYMEHYSNAQKISAKVPTVNKLVGTELVRTTEVDMPDVPPEEYSIDFLISAGVDPNKDTIPFEEKDSLNVVDAVENACIHAVAAAEKSQFEKDNSKSEEK